jgi:hypothetical protein
MMDAQLYAGAKTETIITWYTSLRGGTAIRPTKYPSNVGIQDSAAPSNNSSATVSAGNASPRKSVSDKFLIIYTGRQ